jgi:hypothetical protein
MTVVGEYHYSALGLFITVFGVVLAAVKVTPPRPIYLWPKLTHK